MKPFENWQTQEVQLTFGIKRVDTLPKLEAWLAAEEPIDDFERMTLSKNHRAFCRKAEFWNEDEIKFFFISKIITLVDFNKEDVYSTFTQRTITAKVKDKNGITLNLRGRVELLVALGEQIPYKPFFFLNEYKPAYKTNPSDPRGQLLIAMLATQNINDDATEPIYGAYVVGKLWRFVLLQGNRYAESIDFNATIEKDLYKIFSILKRCKIYIESEIEKMKNI